MVRGIDIVGPYLQTIIGWYQWRMGILRVNQEYHLNSDMEDDRILYMHFGNSAKAISFQLREIDDPTFCYSSVWFIYQSVDRLDSMDVGILPRRYVFSSGLNCPSGYFNVYPRICLLHKDFMSLGLKYFRVRDWVNYWEDRRVIRCLLARGKPSVLDMIDPEVYGLSIDWID